MTSLGSLLSAATIDRIDSELLMAHSLGKDRAFVLAHPEFRCSPIQESRFRQLLERRINREPLAYIIGEKEFYGFSFFVDKSVLVPRPETELLVDEALEFIKNNFHSDQEEVKEMTGKKIAVVDVGTGSGCIITSILKKLHSENFPLNAFSFYAIDVSAPALRTAQRNASRHRLKKDITFLQSDLLQEVKDILTQYTSVIVLANLPYLSPALYETSPSDVRNFEPKGALLSPDDGLAHYRRLVAEIMDFPKGQTFDYFLEISPEQETQLGFLPQPVRILSDLSGRPRIVVGSLIPR